MAMSLVRSLTRHRHHAPFVSPDQAWNSPVFDFGSLTVSDFPEDDVQDLVVAVTHIHLAIGRTLPLWLKSAIREESIMF